jgi:Tfp pilus assembly protein PilZ
VRSERRQVSREARRIHLVFWDRDHPADRRTGFTSDASIGGVFVESNRPLRSGTRIQMEFDRNPGSFLIEGLVVRSVSVPPDLRKVRPGGMGVRLLDIDALLRELESRSPPRSKPTPASPDDRPDEEADEEGAGETPTADGEAAPRRPKRRTVFEREPAATDPARMHPAAARLRGTGEERVEGARPEPPPQPPTFPIAFRSFDDLRQAWESEIKLGGLFVPTDSPAPVGSAITVSLQLPLGRGVIEASARVVQALLPGGSALAGMGIVVDDEEGLAADLREILETE